MRHISPYALILIFISTLASAQTPEQRAAHHLDSIRNQPSLLLAFLHDMPKGGDLHNHLDGAVYAEDIIDWAASYNLCVDRTTSRLLAPPCDSCEHYTPKPAIRCAYDDHILFNQITVFDHALTKPWGVLKKARRDTKARTFWQTSVCAENNPDYFGLDDYKVPTANKPDF